MRSRKEAHAEVNGDNRRGGLSSKNSAKHNFGRRIYRLMRERGWNQSELARQADLPRDSISVYVRGLSLPSPERLKSLAKALGINPTELLPSVVESYNNEDVPSLELRVSAHEPSRAWLRVDRFVRTQTATKIIQLLDADDAGELDEKRRPTEPKKSLVDLLRQDEPEADFDFEFPKLSNDMGLKIPDFDD